MIRFPTLAGLEGQAWLGILGTALAMAFIASAETLLSAAALDQMQNRQKTNYDRELTAQGVGNMLCGLVGALPMTGVIVRSSTNVQAGAQTRKSTIMHGAWILLSVLAFPFLIRMIPTASLAAVLVFVGIKLVNPANVKKLARFGRVPVLIYFASLLTIVFTNLLTGVMVGLGLSLLKLLYSVTHLEIRVVEQGDETHVHLSGIATFLGIPKITTALEQVKLDTVVHLHSHGLRFIDHACIEVIEAWVDHREEQGQQIVVEMEKLHLRFHTRVSEHVI